MVWKKESERHGLAKLGIKTNINIPHAVVKQKIPDQKYEELQYYIPAHLENDVEDFLQDEGISFGTDGCYGEFERYYFTLLIDKNDITPAQEKEFDTFLKSIGAKFRKSL